MTDRCPHCAASLIGDPIPQASRDRGYLGDRTHYRREIGIEIRGVYDGVLYWQCPDCGRAWNRWSPKDGHIYTAAQERVERVNARVEEAL